MVINGRFVAFADGLAIASVKFVYKGGQLRINGAHEVSKVFGTRGADEEMAVIVWQTKLENLNSIFSFVFAPKVKEEGFDFRHL